MIQVIIPTYNRPKCIELLLRNCINVYQGQLFKFVILDSSTNNETAEIAKEYCIAEYKRFDSTVKVDDKVIGSILECCEDYYWLFGDGNLADFNFIEKLIIKLPYFDVLEVDSSKSKRNTKLLQEDFETHDDLVDFIRTRYSHLTYWGSAIVKTEIAKEMFNSGKMDKYRQDVLSWWSAAMVCEMISDVVGKGKKPKIYTLFTEHFYGNPAKKDKSWAKGENYFLTTFKVFDKDVYMLPKYFDEVKNDIICIFRNDVLATRRYLIHLKRQNVIKLRYVLKYKNDIQDVKGYFPFILVLACIPKFCVEIAYNTLKLLKGGS
ncbi:MAG: glycosyltransferase [Anaerostipes hadrus]|nr:glycosyltransferase [Anaerostipes hadrus]